MFQAWVFTIQVDVSGDDLGTSLRMIYYKTIIVCLFDLLLLVQCNLDLATLSVSAKTVTKSHKWSFNNYVNKKRGRGGVSQKSTLYSIVHISEFSLQKFEKMNN